MRVFCLAVLSLALATPAFAADCTTDVARRVREAAHVEGFPCRVQPADCRGRGANEDRLYAARQDAADRHVSGDARRAADDAGRRPRLCRDERQFRRASAPVYAIDCCRGQNQAVVASPKELGSFECLGAAKLDDQDLVAYRTAEKIPAGADLEDHGANDLRRSGDRAPAFNVVAALAGHRRSGHEGQVFLSDRHRDCCTGQRARAKAPLRSAISPRRHSFRIFHMRRIALAAIVLARNFARLRPSHSPRRPSRHRRQTERQSVQRRGFRGSSEAQEVIVVPHGHAHAHRERADVDADRLCSARSHASDGDGRDRPIRRRN